MKRSDATRLSRAVDPEGSRRLAPGRVREGANGASQLAFLKWRGQFKEITRTSRGFRRPVEARFACVPGDRVSRVLCRGVLDHANSTDSARAGESSPRTVRGLIPNADVSAGFMLFAPTHGEDGRHAGSNFCNGSLFTRATDRAILF